MSAPYSTRLAAALAAELPDDVDVVDSQGLIVITRGSVNATVWGDVSGYDKRRAVTPADVATARERAAASLARGIPHYVPRFVEPSRELVAILRGEA